MGFSGSCERRQPERCGMRRYLQFARRKNHRIALGAVARHLAAAAWPVLQGKEKQREVTGGFHAGVSATSSWGPMNAPQTGAYVHAAVTAQR